MSKRDTRTPEQQEYDFYLAQVEARENRLDETLTRRDVVEAIKNVSSKYACSGTHDDDLIAGAFAELAIALS